MKRVVRASYSVVASDSNKSDIQEAKSIAEALQYVLEDMDDAEFARINRKCPGFYAGLKDFIRLN